ncbi:MAG: DUF6048 family protein [Leeuwenhoekiella sp.]
MLAATALCSAQQVNVEAEDQVIVQDTLPKIGNNKYGLRVGIDIGKILRSFLDDQYQGIELMGDFRIDKDYYLAAELGNAEFNSIENTLDATSRGSYIKAGINYNAYNNWYGMSNLIYVGGRVGFASFEQELNNYSIYTTSSFFEPDFRTNSRTFSGLSATWLELQLGIQTELFNNLYLGLNLQLKRTITNKQDDNFDTLFIPGFNKLTTDSPFGVGYGYTLSYLIPIFKK